MMNKELTGHLKRLKNYYGSYRKVAQATGVSNATISQILNGKRNTSPKLELAIANYMRDFRESVKDSLAKHNVKAFNEAYGSLNDVSQKEQIKTVKITMEMTYE